MKALPSLLLTLAALPALAEGTRELGAHEHGTGHLNIAVDGGSVVMEFEAPGADIVGFEHAASSAEDRDAIENAVTALARPLDLFVLPGEAECTVTQARVSLLGEDGGHGDGHGHDHEEAHDDHDHDHEETADADAHDHDHSEGGDHTEFHAEYALNCASPDALTGITFAYFDIFENAREIEVQIVTDGGAQAFEVTRDAPSLDLDRLF